MKVYRMDSRKKNEQLQLSLSEALEKFWKSENILVPNYYSFMEWIINAYKQMKIKRSLPLHMRPIITGSEALLSDIAVEATRYGILIEKNKNKNTRIVAKIFGVPKKKHQSKHKALNKANLLLHYLEKEDDRTIDVLSIIQSQNDNPNPILNISTPLHLSSQAELRAFFLDAIIGKNDKLVFKILGALRTEKHDTNELQYLQAMAFFYGDEFNEAIESAKLVSSVSLDWWQAQLIILESFARLGNAQQVIEKVTQIKDTQNFKNLSHPFILYLYQQCVFNGGENEIVFDIFEVLSDLKDQESGSEVANRFSCHIAMLYAEEREESLIQLKAIKASLEKSEFKIESKLSKMVHALAVDRRFSDLPNLCKKQISRLIVRFLGSHKNYSKEDLLQSLSTQWRLRDDENFLKNILNLLSNSSVQQSKEFQQFLPLAYQIAESMGRKKDANKIINKFPKANTKNAAQGIILREIYDNLSPKGNLALKSALHVMEIYEPETSTFRDAGMISLGFYRILEVEYNEKLILPILSESLLEQIEIFCQISDSPESKKERKAKDQWKKMMPQIKKGLADKSGLELASIEMFLNKIVSSTGPDKHIKLKLKETIYAILTDEGRDALNKGELTQPISSEYRERFRNPPAHTRFVDIETAKECKSFVFHALTKLFSSIRDNNINEN